MQYDITNEKCKNIQKYETTDDAYIERVGDRVYLQAPFIYEENKRRANIIRRVIRVANKSERLVWLF